MNKLVKILLSIILGLLISGQKEVYGQNLISYLESESRYNIQRINGDITLDGLSNEEAWNNVDPLKFVQQKPNFNTPPSENAEVLIACDNEYIYVAGRMFDSEPDKIASSSKERDSGNANCEWFGITLDTFNDNENALAFFTTPSGLRWDAAVINDTQGNITLETTWNTRAISVPTRRARRCSG